MQRKEVAHDEERPSAPVAAEHHMERYEKEERAEDAPEQIAMNACGEPTPRRKSPPAR